MYSYISGLIWLFVIVSLIYIIGQSMCEEKDSFSKKIIVGYVVFTAVGALPGIICQLFHINVFIYYIVYFFIIVGLISFSLHQKKLNKFTKQAILSHFKDNYVIYIVTMMLIVLSIFNIELQWLANHLDDGRYLLLSANYSKVSNPFIIDSATGLFTEYEPIIRSINTFELENSFWVTLFNFQASVFTKVFLAIFNYYIFLNGIKYFIDIVKKQFHVKNKSLLQFAVVAPIILMIISEVLVNEHILYMQDSWQFQSAMWYGSSIVRMCTFFLCLTPIIEKEKIEIKSIIYYIIVSIALVSRATQAVPLLFVISAAYLVVMQKNIKHSIIIFISELTILYFCPVIINNKETINQYCEMTAKTNITSILMICAIIIIFVSYFTKNKIMIKWNNILCISSLFVFCRYFNSMALNLSQYDFVIGRTMTTITVTVIVTAMVYFCLVVIYILRNYWINTLVFATVSCLLFVGVLYTNKQGIGIRERARILYNNNTLVPECILDISEQLEQFSKNQKIVVISPTMVDENRIFTTFATMLRIEAPDIISLSARPRYPAVQEKSIYNEFEQEEQDIIEQFVRGNIVDYTNEINDMIEKFNINCIISLSETTNSYLEEQRFKLKYDRKTESNHYYIYVNEQ